MIHATRPCPKCGAQMAGEADVARWLVIVCPECGHEEKPPKSEIEMLEEMMGEAPNYDRKE